MRFLRFLVDYQKHWSPAFRYRSRRFQFFLSLVRGLPSPLRILDVGGTESFWKVMGLAGRPGVQLTLLNIDVPPAPTLPGVTALQCDARDLSRFADQSFDVVFSNSVIEHVGGLEDQRRMAQEVQRTGRAFFIQTPNRHFPIEPHFVFPFFQFLPLSWRAFLLRHFRLGWSERIPDRAEALRIANSAQLLDRRTVAALFPGAKIHAERALGLVKSFIVYGGFPSSLMVAAVVTMAGR